MVISADGPAPSNTPSNGHSGGNGTTINGHHGTEPGINSNSTNGSVSTGNGTTDSNTHKKDDPSFTPIAICGMACRLPGGIFSPQELWSFLLDKRDAQTPIPKSRYNLAGYHSAVQKPGTTKAGFGYFLDETVDLGAIDTSFFSMARTEVERVDPQHRLLLEVSREALEDAGEKNWRGQNIGVYAGSYGQDWYDLYASDSQKYSMYQVTANHDFMLSNRVSYEMDLRGPSMTIRTGCSAALVGLNEACLALGRGDCQSAIVGGTNLLLGPGLTTTMSELGALNKDGSCKTFSANVDGYGRGEAIVALFVKPLSDALRDGNSIRGIISGAAVNHDGKTNGVSVPSSDSQEALIRRAYEIAGIPDLGQTGFFECHGTGTAVGDPIETEAVARVFGDVGGVQIGSIKPNLGHSEGASGLTSVIKAVLALEHRTIPPNIKSYPPNPKIPWERGQLTVPVEPENWPAGRHDRVSVNSFGIGGTNAHVIIESAASFGIAQKDSDTRLAVGPRIIGKETPHLLVYSANASSSLKKMSEQYGAFLESNPESLIDVAYTLAAKREYLPHRSFAIATRSNVGPAVSLDKVAPNPTLVMVFTGQGAQWPQMGRDLMKWNPKFLNTIRALDKELQDLRSGAPGWTIEEELAKPVRTSRINEAEFSQPLCTAVQLALVDTLASASITPAAVVGHSSGEIAAAYAAGGLSLREAITVAYYRGLITKRQTRIGAMAAIGLGWEQVQEYLVPDVTVACDNSPTSVTLSGDADRISEVVATIKATRDGILATTLKVDKAYHSDHMVEIGKEYLLAMSEAGVIGREPVKPFFSSVSGKLLQNPKGTGLGPKYWQTNLESPVLFRAAVLSILNDTEIRDPIFLEIGPHSALAGPLRQTKSQVSNTSPILPSLVRKQNGVENILSLVGSLFSLHYPVNVEAFIKKGTCLPDLPRYPWNHQRSYCFESRVTKEWRLREYPYHDLLGMKVLESTDIEPAWRNIFHLDNAPWMRDHKIKDDIIFPFAGYVAIAGEAVRQVTHVQDGFSIRNVAVNAALVVSQGKPTELVTSMRRHRLTNELDSQWWEFTVTSHNGHTWMKHCSGQVRAEIEVEPAGDVEATETSSPNPLPRKVSARKWYEVMRKKGLDYGPHFTCLEDVRTSTTSPRLAVANVRNNWHGDEANYHLHPVILDSYFQLLSCAARHGLAQDYRQVVPTSVTSLTMFRSAADEISVLASATVNGNAVVGDGTCIADSKTILRVSGVGVTPLDDPGMDDDSSKSNMKARCEWVRHIDFEERNVGLIKMNRDLSSFNDSLNEIAQLGCIISQKALVDDAVTAASPFLQKYKAWLNGQNSEIQHPEEEIQALQNRFNSLVESLVNTPVECVAAAMSKVCENAASILTGSQDAFNILSDAGVFEKISTLMKQFGDISAFIKCLGLSTPNLRVLELGAGFGTTTEGVLKDLTRADGQILYSKYVFSDPSLGIVNSAKKTFNDRTNLEFASLDIGKEPADQGFQDQEFDLIIASNVFHTTNQLQRSLAYAKKLLSPSGRILIQETLPHLMWAKYIFGSLSTWYSGCEDGRIDEPYIDVDRWSVDMKTAGLSLISRVTSEQNTVMVAKPTPQDGKLNNGVTVLCADKTMPLTRLEEELQTRGYDISRCTISEIPISGQDVIALLETENSFFENMDGVRLRQFQDFVANLRDAGLLWVTHSSQLHCRDPTYALIMGLSRTLRSELAIDFATCETEDLDGTFSIIADVFAKFYTRDHDTSMGPDYEYSISDGSVHVNRFFPLIPDDEPMEVDANAGDAILQVGHPGRLGSLHWSAKSFETPRDDQVEVEVYSVGLNFRDVLIAMGILELPEPILGYEAVGVVRRIGPLVTKVSVGDRVCLMGIKTFATLVTDTEQFYEKIPDNLSFSDAASMPLAFATAIHSLINMGRLRKGQSVLIHSGCGGVGLAAIQIALMIGADIYTTVSSEVKVNYLTDTFGIPRTHIFDSRSTSFVDGIMRETNNRGADVILNSLSGDLLHATWHCVAKWGTMIEIGKRDLLGAGKLDMDVFLENRNYCCVDINQMRAERPEMIEQLLRSMMDYYRDGYIHPVRLAQVSNADQIQDTFKYMQQGSHIGKIVVNLRDNSGALQLGQVEQPKVQQLELDSAGCYLLVGGLGGLGRSISVWMVQHGARNLTFLSRNAGNGKNDNDFKHELESMGCIVNFVRGSVTDRDDVSRAVDSSPAPLKGVIQMSMVLRDQNFSRMTLEEWNGSIEPKVNGTWNLHDATRARKIPLDFFILFSSLSGIFGQPGQANYAAANTFLDAFSRYRADLGLPCTAIDIGAMEGAGYLAENEDLLRKMQGTGWRPVQEIELLNALGEAMRISPRSQTTDKSVNSGVNQSSFLLGINLSNNTRQRRDVRMSVYHNRRSTKDSNAQAQNGPSSNNKLAALLAAAKNDASVLTKPDAASLVARGIGEKLFALLLKTGQEVDISMGLTQLGLDSMVAVELRAWWKETFGFDISVLEMLGMGTLEALGQSAMAGLIARYEMLLRSFRPKGTAYKVHARLIFAAIANNRDGAYGQSKPSSTPTPLGKDKNECQSVSGDHWAMSRDVAVDNAKVFCKQGDKKVKYNKDSVNELELSVSKKDDDKKGPKDDPNCLGRLQAAVIDGCDGNESKNNPHHYKFGSTFTSADGWVYEMKPQSKQVNEVSCDVSYKFWYDSFDVRGKNLPDAKFGAEGEGLKNQLAGCGKMTEWHFERTPHDVKFQWYAKGKLPIGCIGRALESIDDWPGYGDDGAHVFRERECSVESRLIFRGVYPQTENLAGRLKSRVYDRYVWYNIALRGLVGIVLKFTREGFSFYQPNV